jgi:sialate O-acetylesterase
VNNAQNPGVGRYGGADYPEMNLWNKAGLPASPFRTDNFPMTTAPE